jgi:hypothetical protein
MHLAWGTVLEITGSTKRKQLLRVALDEDGRGVAVPGATVRAINYLDTAPPVQPQDEVIINITALDLQLGTGGYAFVVPADLIYDTPASEGGHVMKLRYTPLQREVCSVEEKASPYHAVMRDACSLQGLPVVCCELHSQIPLVAAAIRSVEPGAHITYCMTDQAALMLAFSDLIEECRRSGLIDATITCGQALGGMLEAVNLHSGLLAARHVLRTDVCIAGIGPGIVGTSTPFGHGGVAQGESLNAAASLSGLPIAPLRMSFVDKRASHYGLDQHSITALRDICMSQVHIALPMNLTAEQAEEVTFALHTAKLYGYHEIHKVDFDESLVDMRGLNVTTMGRSKRDDPAFFSAAYAAGVLAGRFIDGRR